VQNHVCFDVFFSEIPKKRLDAQVLRITYLVVQQKIGYAHSPLMRQPELFRQHRLWILHVVSLFLYNIQSGIPNLVYIYEQWL